MLVFRSAFTIDNLKSAELDAASKQAIEVTTARLLGVPATQVKVVAVIPLYVSRARNLVRRVLGYLESSSSQHLLQAARAFLGRTVSQYVGMDEEIGDGRGERVGGSRRLQELSLTSRIITENRVPSVQFPQYNKDVAFLYADLMSALETAGESGLFTATLVNVSTALGATATSSAVLNRIDPPPDGPPFEVEYPATEVPTERPTPGPTVTPGLFEGEYAERAWAGVGVGSFLLVVILVLSVMLHQRIQRQKQFAKVYSEGGDVESGVAVLGLRKSFAIVPDELVEQEDLGKIIARSKAKKSALRVNWIERPGMEPYALQGGTVEAKDEEEAKSPYALLTAPSEEESSLQLQVMTPSTINQDLRHSPVRLRQSTSRSAGASTSRSANTRRPISLGGVNETVGSLFYRRAGAGAGAEEGECVYPYNEQQNKISGAGIGYLLGFGDKSTAGGFGVGSDPDKGVGEGGFEDLFAIEELESPQGDSELRRYRREGIDEESKRYRQVQALRNQMLQKKAVYASEQRKGVGTPTVLRSKAERRTALDRRKGDGGSVHSIVFNDRPFPEPLRSQTSPEGSLSNGSLATPPHQRRAPPTRQYDLAVTALDVPLSLPDTSTPQALYNPFLEEESSLWSEQGMDGPGPVLHENGDPDLAYLDTMKSVRALRVSLERDRHMQGTSVGEGPRHRREPAPAPSSSSPSIPTPPYPSAALKWNPSTAGTAGSSSSSPPSFELGGGGGSMESYATRPYMDPRNFQPQREARTARARAPAPAPSSSRPRPGSTGRAPHLTPAPLSRGATASSTTSYRLKSPELLQREVEAYTRRPVSSHSFSRKGAAVFVPGQLDQEVDPDRAALSRERAAAEREVAGAAAERAAAWQEVDLNESLRHLNAMSFGRK